MSRSRIQVVVELKDHPVNSRASSTGRSRMSETPNRFLSTTMFPNSTISKRQTRSSAGSTVGSMNGEEDLVDDFPHPSVIGLNRQKNGKAKPAVSRASMSSISTVNDYATSSGYSTPATSAVATPAVLPKQETESSLPRPRGRPRSALTNKLPPATLDAFQRAKNMRNSEFSLNPVGNKRKRYSSDEDEDDSDDSPDAKLAKTLQDEENAMAKMFENDDSDVVTARRTRRALRTIRPKSDYVEDSSEGEFDVKPNTLKGNYSSATSSSKSKLQAAPAAKSPILISTDSEISEYFTSDSDDNFEIDQIDMRVSDSNKVVARRTMRATKKLTRPRMNAAPKQQPVSVRSRGTSSRGRGFTRGGSCFTTSRRVEDGAELVAADQAEDPVQAFTSLLDDSSDLLDSDSDDTTSIPRALHYTEIRAKRRAEQDRQKLEIHHPELLTMWEELKNLPAIKTVRAEQPTNITRQLKPFQLEGLTWMKAMEKTEWGGGLLGDEMGMGKTIQAVSLIMSDYPAKNPSLVLIPPVALMQWQQEIGDYTDGTLKTFVFHGTNKVTKGMSVKDLKKYDVILMSYNSLESMYRHQEKGFKRKEALHFEKSVIHQIHFHRVILDEAHNIKTRTTGVAKACFALKADHKWCLSGTPLQNRIGEFFSLVRFLDIKPFACYFCKQCPCKPLEWSMNAENRCTGCSHSGMQHVSVFNQELLNPIQKYGNTGLGKKAFEKLRILTDRFMLRRVKRDHSSAMELPAKEIQVDRQFFGEEENDFAASIMNSGTRKFETYVAQGVMLNNYANIFGLIMQMRQVADHPDLILKKNGEGGQNILVCCICDEPAEEAVRSTCRHDFCRSCVRNYLKSSDESNIQPDCPQCHIPLSIDLEQPELEQDQQLVKKSSIINRIKMENWTSSSKIEALVHDLHSLRSYKSSSKSIIFSQFTTMLQLVEWRLRRAGITTVMLDGSMTPAQRQASINHFMNDVNVECFLVSLKAGGVALNLTEASKVFIVDPWWNPAAEWQSADRCHRIGQCRPCSITRLCIEDSVESRMVLLQEKKANMINSTINADDSAMESLTPEDMQFLFRGN